MDTQVSQTLPLCPFREGDVYEASLINKVILSMHILEGIIPSYRRIQQLRYLASLLVIRLLNTK